MRLHDTKIEDIQVDDWVRISNSGIHGIVVYKDEEIIKVLWLLDKLYVQSFGIPIRLKYRIDHLGPPYL